jgi:tetratricopeptide (TPR) repeat protein
MSGLARTFHLEWLLLARRDAGLLDTAVRLAERAVEMDPADGRGHRELGVAQLYGRRFDESLMALAAAEHSSPRHADVLADYADTLLHASDPMEGVERIEAAIALNPICPDDYWWTAGGAYYLVENYAKSVDSLSRMTDQRPAGRLMAASLAMLGERIEARRYVRRVKEEHPDFRVDAWLSIVPFRDPRRRDHYEEGLRLAGFE